VRLIGHEDASAEALHEGDGAVRRALNATTMKPSALPPSPAADAGNAAGAVTKSVSRAE
jgi:hypothetical protein